MGEDGFGGRMGAPDQERNGNGGRDAQYKESGSIHAFQSHPAADRQGLWDRSAKAAKRPTMRLTKFAVLAFCISAAGCSGGSSASPPPGAPQAVAVPAKLQGPTVPATLTINIPARTPSHDARLPKFVPSQVNSIVIAVNGSSSVTTNVTPSVSTYSISVPVAIGSNTFVVSLFDGANASGNLLGQGTQTTTITQAGPNNVPVTINGKVAFISFNIVPLSQTQINIFPVGIDAQGNIISGTYLSSITLNDTDVSGHTNLNGAGTTATVTALGQSATLNWDTIGATGCSAVTVQLTASGPVNTVGIPLGSNVVTNLNPSGAGSLANAIGGGGTIVFAVTGTIPWPSSVSVTANQSICGPPGTSPTIILNGTGSGGMLVVSSSVNATISNIKFQNGSNSAGGGGAINMIGPAVLNLNFDVFSSNQATGASNAGAIYENPGNTLTINGCRFNSNATTGSGNGGALVIAGNATILQSLFHGNSAGQFGGAIYDSGNLTINSTTIYSNNATGQGGGIYVASGGTILSLNGSTVLSNSSASGPASVAFPATGTVNITNSMIFGANTTDFTNNLYNVSYSLVGSTNGATITGTGNLLNGATPTLSALANNGGPTQTLKLLSGPGVGAIPTGSCTPSFDQRGVMRPTSGPFCDMGAYEKT